MLALPVARRVKRKRAGNRSVWWRLDRCGDGLDLKRPSARVIAAPLAVFRVLRCA